MSEPAPAPFVVGAPRSGTTMLRSMLDAHPAVAIPHETAFYRALLKVPFTAPDWLEQALDARERHAEIGDVVREGRRYDKNVIASLMHTDRPPFVTSVGRWRTAMSPAEAAACERLAGSLLGELGYAPEHGGM